MNNFFVTIVLALVLSGCATGYQPDGYTGGFSEVQFDENVFEIRFSGNAMVGANTARDYAMLRAAEVTLENGYEYFVVLGEEDRTAVSTHTSGGSSTTTYDSTMAGNSVQGTANTTYKSPQTNTYHKPTSRKTIMLFHEKPEDVISYSARFVRESIRSAHDIDD